MTNYETIIWHPRTEKPKRIKGSTMTNRQCLVRTLGGVFPMMWWYDDKKFIYGIQEEVRWNYVIEWADWPNGSVDECKTCNGIGASI